MIRLSADADTINMLSSTPNELAVSVSGKRASGADVSAINVAYSDTFNPEGVIITGGDGQRSDITSVVVTNPADSGVTPRVKITETVSDVTVTLFYGIIPPGYAATMQTGNVFTVAPAVASADSVTTLIAGSGNVTLDPADGKGDVTVTVDGDASGALLAENNLSDLTDVDAAVLNLELAPVAVSGRYNDLRNLPDNRTNPTVGFDIDTNTTTGLTLGLTAGRINFDFNSDLTFFAADTVTLFDNTQNLVIMCPDKGADIPSAVVVIDGNADQATFLPINNWQLYQITTSGGEIVSTNDVRVTTFAGFLSYGILGDGYMYQYNGDPDFNLQIKSLHTMTPKGTVFVNTVDAAVLEDDATNYIEVNGKGEITVNQSGFTPGKASLMTAELVGGVLHALNDFRGFMYVPGVTTQILANGATAGNVVVSGIEPDDLLESVLQYTDGALVAVLTSEFTISGSDQINNTGGTDTTGDKLLVTWKKLTG